MTPFVPHIVILTYYMGCESTFLEGILSEELHSFQINSLHI